MLQRKGHILVGHKAALVKAHPVRLTRFSKAQAVVLELPAGDQGHIEAGVAAETKIHGLAVQILAPEGNVQRLALQGVDDLEHKIPGIFGIGLFIGAKLEDHAVAVVFGHNKVPVGGDAVDGHIMELAVQIIPALVQPGHIGENVQGPVGPVFAVALPEVLGAVRAENGHELSARLLGADRQKFIFDGVDHTRRSKTSW